MVRIGAWHILASHIPSAPGGLRFAYPGRPAETALCCKKLSIVVSVLFSTGQHCYLVTHIHLILDHAMLVTP
jgi:hypothetical protein